jgi:hypothetical protein
MNPKRCSECAHFEVCVFVVDFRRVENAFTDEASIHDSITLNLYAIAEDCRYFCKWGECPDCGTLIIQKEKPE